MYRNIHETKVKTMKNITLITLAVMLYCLTMSAQPNGTTKGMVQLDNNFMSNNFSVRPVAHQPNLKDSPMLFEDDQKGWVVLKNKSKIEQPQLNYDLLAQEVVIASNDQLYSVDNKYLDSLVISGFGSNDVYIFSSVKGDKNIKMLQVLVDGDFTLYKSIDARLKQPNYNPVLDTGNRDPSINKRDIFYVRDGNHVIQIPTKEKKLRKAKYFSSSFKSGVKELKPNLKKEQSLVEFFLEMNKNAEINS